MNNKLFREIRYNCTYVVNGNKKLTQESKVETNEM